MAARLRWRQGGGAWRELTDGIFPYEFSPELADDGDFQCVLEVETASGKVERSPLICLPLRGGKAITAEPPTGAGEPIFVAVPIPPAGAKADATDEFLAYLKAGSNPLKQGLRADGRFYPYSTPLGRRIAWGLPVWDRRLFTSGCTTDDAERQLRSALAHAAAELTAALAKRSPPVRFAELSRDQREVLLDFALSEGVGGIRADVLVAVIAGDWAVLGHGHRYVRYAGAAPDHARNKAFAERWVYSGRLGIAPPERGSR
jgi:hypothetical protein